MFPRWLTELKLSHVIWSKCKQVHALLLHVVSCMCAACQWNSWLTCHFHVKLKDSSLQWNPVLQEIDKHPRDRISRINATACTPGNWSPSRHLISHDQFLPPAIRKLAWHQVQCWLPLKGGISTSLTHSATTPGWVPLWQWHQSWHMAPVHTQSTRQTY